jgi:hypothetical protein
MNEANRKAPAHRARFQSTVERLIRELQNLRGSFAAMCAAQGKYSSNLFIHVAAKAVQSDVLIRLIRIVEDGEAASFWYLHRCEPRKVAEGIDIAKLQDFSRRLKLVRDKVFVHIEKDEMFDPERAYKDAAIKVSEIEETIETLWAVINRLYLEQSGKPFTNRPQSTLDSLIQDFTRDFTKLSSE